MSTAMVRGQNLPWPDPVITVTVHHPGDVSALLLGADERVRSSDDLAFYNQPNAAATTWSAGPPQTVRVMLDDLDPAVRTVRILLSVDPGTEALGNRPAPRAELAGTSAIAATFLADGLTTERALIVCEIYRRGADWRVRAVGQGYDGGLSQALTAHGVDVEESGSESAAAPTPAPTPAPAAGPGTAAASHPPPGTSPVERLARQGSAILEDASRSTASLQSTLAFAHDRLTRTLEQLVADPATRLGPHADAARATAHRDHDEMVAKARANHARDMAQLRAELAGWESSLPASMARWTSSAWRQRPTAPSQAIRIGTLQVDDAPDLAVPMLLGTPLTRPLWIDAATGDERAAATLMRSLAIRLQVASAPLGCHVVILDAGAASPVPLNSLGTRVTDPAGITAALTDLVRHLDLVEMARQSGDPQTLVELDLRPRLLLVHDVPTGLSEHDLVLLIRLTEMVSAGGIHLVLTGTDSASLDHPILTALLRSCLRLPCGQGGVLTDGYAGTSWDFTPDSGPDEGLLAELPSRLAPPRPTHRRP